MLSPVLGAGLGSRWSRWGTPRTMVSSSESLIGTLQDSAASFRNTHQDRRYEETSPGFAGKHVTQTLNAADVQSARKWQWPEGLEELPQDAGAELNSEAPRKKKDVRESRSHGSVFSESLHEPLR